MTVYRRVVDEQGGEDALGRVDQKGAPVGDHLMSVHVLRDERVLVQPISRTVNGVMISDGV